jgi:hypothetical protein
MTNATNGGQPPWRKAYSFEIGAEAFAEILRLGMIPYHVEMDPPKVGEVWKINGQAFLIKRAVPRGEFVNRCLVLGLTHWADVPKEAVFFEIKGD